MTENISWKANLLELANHLEDRCKHYCFHPDSYSTHDFFVVGHIERYEDYWYAVEHDASPRVRETILNEIGEYPTNFPPNSPEVHALLPVEYALFHKLTDAVIKGLCAENLQPPLKYDPKDNPVYGLYHELRILRDKLAKAEQEDKRALTLDRSPDEYRDLFQTAIDALPKMVAGATDRRGKSGRKHPQDSGPRLKKKAKIDIIKSHISENCGGHWDGSAVDYLKKLKAETRLEVPDSTFSKWRDKDRSLDRLFSPSAPAYESAFGEDPEAVAPWRMPDSDDE